MVLATDNSVHSAYLAKLESLVRRYASHLLAIRITTRS